ncbi:MAG TPA: RNA 2',3'-cyclic phosphodiesterase [Isosphaeraceae bacterium]|nr:RNA 2',3'-cyclic phosphodiesterase [Isosphaeraceae bacterium]
MPDTTRTFIAVEVPREGRERIERLIGRLAPDAKGARWVATENLHVTLAFLGDVRDADLDSVCRAVAAAARPFEPLELALEGLGCFGSPTRPRTLWAGIQGPGLEGLKALQKEIATAVAREGYRADDRFDAHVTLARFKSGRGPAPNLTGILEKNRGWSGGAWRVAEVITLASTLTPERPVYAPLARAHLRGEKPSTGA